MSDSTTPDLSTLTDDGDTLDLGNGRSLRLIVRPDDISVMDHVNGCDAYGRLEWSMRQNDYGYSPRPDDMDGSARIVYRDRGSVLWWAPWEGATDEAIREFVPLLRDLLEYGFHVVGVELRETLTDSVGNDHVVELDTAWCGGIDDVSSDYLPEVVADLYEQVIFDVEKRVAAA